MDKRTVWLASWVAVLAGTCRADEPPTLQLVSTTACNVCHDGAPLGPLGLNVEVTPEGRHLALYTGQGGAPHVAFLDLETNIDRQTGLTLATVDKGLQTRMALPEGRGLMVTAVAADGPGAGVGLKVHDVLLAVGDTPLSQPDDLIKGLKAAGEQPVMLEVRRDDKPLQIEIRPIYRVSFGPAKEEPRDYYIGVPVEPPGELLRSHLDLPEGRGLVATDVAPDSPAAKAGLKKNDILLSLDDKPLPDADALRAAIQASGGKPVSVKLLRGGKPLTVEVTPEPRPAENQAALKAWSGALQNWKALEPHGYSAYTPNHRLLQQLYRTPAMNKQWDARVFKEFGAADHSDGRDGLDRRLDELTRQVEALRKSVEELRKPGR